MRVTMRAHQLDLGRKKTFLAIFWPKIDRSDRKSGQIIFSLRLDEKSGQISASGVTKKSGQVFKKAKIPVPTSVGIIRGPDGNLICVGGPVTCWIWHAL